MKIRVTLQAITEVDPSWYPEDIQNDPKKMMELDLGNDPGAFLAEADLQILAATVESAGDNATI